MAKHSPEVKKAKKFQNIKIKKKMQKVTIAERQFSFKEIRIRFSLQISLATHQEDNEMISSMSCWKITVILEFYTQLQYHFKAQAKRRHILSIQHLRTFSTNRFPLKELLKMYAYIQKRLKEYRGKSSMKKSNLSQVILHNSANPIV